MGSLLNATLFIMHDINDISMGGLRIRYLRDGSKVELPKPADQTSKDGRHQDIEEGTEHEGAKNADGHIPLRVARLLCRGGHGVEANVREEDGGGSGGDSSPAILPGSLLRRNEWVPVGPGEIGMVKEISGTEIKEDGDDSQQGGTNNGVRRRFLFHSVISGP